jgi:hypothetical protein
MCLNGLGKQCPYENKLFARNCIPPIIKVWFDDGIPVNTHCAWFQMLVTPGKFSSAQLRVDQMTRGSYSKRLENGRTPGTDVTNYHDVRHDNEA